jgi:hypothetical protein
MGARIFAALIIRAMGLAAWAVGPRTWPVVALCVLFAGFGAWLLATIEREWSFAPGVALRRGHGRQLSAIDHRPSW